jgi:hypothetical protein
MLARLLADTSSEVLRAERAEDAEWRALMAMRGRTQGGCQGGGGARERGSEGAGEGEMR